MNKHWNIEVAVVEHGRDVRQMRANLVLGCIVFIRLDIDFDDASVRKKREVMSCGFVGKSHCMIATVVQACSFVSDLLMLLVHGAFHGCLGLCTYGHAQGGDENQCLHSLFLSVVGWSL